MLSFNNNPAIKEEYLSRVINHRIADEIQKGIYWENGKGCAVGCTIHGNDHSKYETELGIPQILARLEDGIFENIPNDRAKIWPEQFLESIKIGVDLSSVWPRFAVWLLTDEVFGVIKHVKNEIIRKLIQRVSDAYAKYSEVTLGEWKEIYASAYAAAADAAAAAYAYASAASASSSAYAAYATAAAASAADASAADASAASASSSAYAAYATAATASAADASAAAADAASAFAYAAYATAAAASSAFAYAAYATAAAASSAFAYAAAADARIKIRLAQADKLLELLRECK